MEKSEGRKWKSNAWEKYERIFSFLFYFSSGSSYGKLMLKLNCVWLEKRGGSKNEAQRALDIILDK
jgi:hypothetical protein